MRAKSWPSKALCSFIVDFFFLFLLDIACFFLPSLGLLCPVMLIFFNKVFCTAGVSLVVLGQKNYIIFSVVIKEGAKLQFVVTLFRCDLIDSVVIEV
jgi:hypothetical protein